VLGDHARNSAVLLEQDARRVRDSNQALQFATGQIQDPLRVWFGAGLLQDPVEGLCLGQKVMGALRVKLALGDIARQSVEPADLTRSVIAIGPNPDLNPAIVF